MEDTKKCTKCGRELLLDRFCKLKSNNDNIKYNSWCKDCCAEASRNWYKNNTERARDTSRAWYKNNPEKARLSRIKWQTNNKDKIKSINIEWQKNNPEKKKASDAKWYYNNLSKVRAASAKYARDNPEKVKLNHAKWRKNNSEHMANYRHNRKISNPTFRIAANIRNAMRMALRRNTKAGHTVELLGCSIEELRNYLEALFLPGMTWDNYGRNGWHIDHIIPLTYFDLSDFKQQKRAWHYTNLQPLWAGDNIRKSNKIEERQLLLL